MKTGSILAGITGAAFAFAGPASASPLTLEETFGIFGAVTQSFSGNSESEGRVLIQGDVTNGTVIVNDREIGDNGDGYDDLIITGSVTNSTVKVGQSGNLTIGGNLTNTQLELNGGVQTVTLGGQRSGGLFNKNEDQLNENVASLNIPDVDFGSYAAKSAELKSLGDADPVVPVKNTSGQFVFGSSTGFMSTSLSQLSTGTGVFDLGAIDTLVINVSGTSGNFGMNVNDYSGINKLLAAESVIWNFFEATSLSFGTTVYGHVLAPLADLSLNSSNEGSVIAKSLLVNNGELHPLSFDGVLPVADSVSAVPLPASILLMLSALGLFGGMRMRRKA